VINKNKKWNLFNLLTGCLKRLLRFARNDLIVYLNSGGELNQPG